MADTAKEIKKPLPEITPVNQRFWDGAKAGKLMMQKCGNCGTWVFPPRPVCGDCASEKLEWVPVSGKGKIFCFTIIREVVGTALRGFGPDIPYVTAWVDLDDGPRFCSNVIGCPIEQVRIDMPVEVVFQDSGDGITLPKFKPAA
ncbi:MAG TPA: Zn-ribbon domain-containing OB-fold protein [Candidatus Binatia bacterium]|nr:Zn-ribbon domain-containing OB-fold protein [Candidatus Binatia bacterium]